MREPTNADLAGVHRLAYQLLAGNPDAPTIASVDVDHYFDGAVVGYRPRIQAHLWAEPFDERLRGVARWAQLLDTDVCVDPHPQNGYVRIAAVTEIAGALVGVWTHLPVTVLAALLPAPLAARCQTGTRLTPAELLAVPLTAA